MRPCKKLCLFFLLLALLLPSGAINPVKAQSQNDPQAVLDGMSAQEKIGQLFLITFDGSEVGEDTDIFKLITEYKIGGVVLSVDNNNFPAEDMITRTSAMVESLQKLTWDLASGSIETTSGWDVFGSSYIPLFIGLQQLGNGFPGDQILTGLTPIPSHMAMGATWDLGLTEQVGSVLGAELNQLGFNLYLGPNLDVLETTNSEAASSLRVNTFGGDPFWVGEMAKSFIRGVHAGSENRMIVVAQNFPGTGNSDRSPEFEVATVRKSLEQLKQIELAPYFSVTNLDIDDPGRVEAVMISHIRYQGFQGNIRATTRPISFDTNALQQIMTLPQFAAWRESGGLIISDNLGSGSVRRFFDPNGTNFDAKQVALNAFLAGNDILFMDDMIASGDPNAFTTLTGTLEFFVQKYREDAAFAQRVDASVLRILQAKMALYGEFSIDQVLLPNFEPESLGTSQNVAFDVAQNAVTLISPSLQEIDTLLPDAPLWYEDILIFTDVRPVRQCEDCPPINQPRIDDFADALIGLYGSEGGNQIQDYNVISYTFSQLAETLDNEENGTAEFVLPSLQDAEWVIFNTLDLNPDFPDSNVLQRILTERPDLLARKNIIVFALDIPTYLDATNISKVTAYYALYSKGTSFFDVAARVLMKELTPSGALPVSLNAVGYDLISVTAPDPNQVITLNLVLPEEIDESPVEEEGQDITQTPVPTQTPSFSVGDMITITTGQIYDHNHHTVPDGTIVRFNFGILGDPGITQQFETTTTGGVANLAYRIEVTGGLEITASSEPAMQSEILQINISPEGVTSVISFSPTPAMTQTPTEMPSATPTEMLTPTPTPGPVIASFPTLGEWALGILVMGFGMILTFLVGYFWWGKTRWGIRAALCALIGALLSYTYLNLGTEGTMYWMEKSGTSFVVEIIVAGLLIGWIGALVWWMRTDGRFPQRNHP